MLRAWVRLAFPIILTCPLTTFSLFRREEDNLAQAVYCYNKALRYTADDESKPHWLWDRSYTLMELGDNKRVCRVHTHTLALFSCLGKRGPVSVGPFVHADWAR